MSKLVKSGMGFYGGLPLSIADSQK